MKPKTQLTSVLIAALLATGAATTVTAQGADAREDRRAQMFTQLDTNGDGSVSAEEFVNRPGRFARADSNGDGMLSTDEIVSMAQARSERHAARMIERLDANDDGLLSKEEVQNRSGQGRQDRMFTRLDANEDGVVSEEEFAELRMKRRGGGDRHDGGKRHGTW